MASVMLRKLEEWGWLRKDYDESLNCYVVSFPDYSQMFTELFGRLYNEESSMERESLLTIYSHLFTYHSSKEKDNEILEKCAAVFEGIAADALEYARRNSWIF